MAESRSDLKKIIDEKNATLTEDQREHYKANTNIDGLNAIIETLDAKIKEQSATVAKNDDGEIDDGFSDDNAVLDESEVPTSDENVSDDESVTEGDKHASRPNMSDKEIPMRTCNGNHSVYPDTKEYFPSKYGGRYSVDYLVSKRLMTRK